MLTGSKTSQINHLQNNFTGTLFKIEKKGYFRVTATSSNKQICIMLPTVALLKFASVASNPTETDCATINESKIRH